VHTVSEESLFVFGGDTLTIYIDVSKTEGVPSACGFK
jgi:hypothetical protein